MNIAYFVQYVTKTVCLMQLGEILASQRPIMFMKGIQIKAQRSLTEDVHRRLLLIETRSAMKFTLLQRPGPAPVNVRWPGLGKQTGN